MKIGTFIIGAGRGSEDETIVVLPICSKCGEPLKNLKEGMIALDPKGEPERVGEIDCGARGVRPLFVRPGTLHAFHKTKCDDMKLTTWFEASHIFKADQSIEQGL